MKLQDMNNSELEQIIEQLERKSKHNLDKYQRWEAQQKLQLALSEQRKRKSANRIFNSLKNLFNK